MESERSVRVLTPLPPPLSLLLLLLYLLRMRSAPSANQRQSVKASSRSGAMSPTMAKSAGAFNSLRGCAFLYRGQWVTVVDEAATRCPLPGLREAERELSHVRSACREMMNLARDYASQCST